MVAPTKSDGDIVGVVIRHIEAHRIGRDAVSIAGGTPRPDVHPQRAGRERALERGYLRGAVEASDGTDNVTVRRVYAEDAAYAIDVHDHGRSAPNTNILVEDVTAVTARRHPHGQRQDQAREPDAAEAHRHGLQAAGGDFQYEQRAG